MSTREVKLKAIQELENRNGRVTAEMLVQAAKSSNHPMHNDFPWDDKVAAHQHRIELARGYIAMVRVQTIKEGKKIHTIAYVRDPSVGPHEQGYISVAKLKTNKTLSQEALLAEIERVVSALERAKELAMALNLEDELTEALNATMKLKKKVDALV